MLLSALSIVLAMLSLLGPRGFGGLYLPPATALASGAAALAIAVYVRHSRGGRGPQLLCEVSLALAICACVATGVAALAIGRG